MNAVEFIKVRRRMYEKHCITKDLITDKPEDVVFEVEKWAKENPAKTRQSEFLKICPNAFMDRGVLSICPMSVDNSFGNTSNFCKHDLLTCPTCRRGFWLQEIE